MNASEPVTLFDGDDRLFITHTAKAARYGEYGMGQSTLWVLRSTAATVRAVDTSRDWVESTMRSAGNTGRAECLWVDVGPLGDWGMPLTYSKRDNFRHYVGAVWAGGFSPDVVLVDGRFRVCCFLHSVLSAKPGTVILFDDYRDRPWYHVAAEFLPVKAMCGRQALFEVPANLDRAELKQARDYFLYVRE